MEIVHTLLLVASDEHEATELQRAAGVALARIYLRNDRLNDAPLHNLTQLAYLAFDETVAGTQR